MANGKRQKKKRSPLSEAMRLELREHRSSFLVYVILRALVVVMMILQLLNRNYENVFLCGLTLQIASPNGHLCHIRRPLCDLIGGQPGTH